MNEFEKGVRFVQNHFETYTVGEGDPETQFGKFTMSMVYKNPDNLLEGSRLHLERRIQSILHLAKKQDSTVSDPESKRKHQKHRRRNFIVKKLRESSQYKKKVHIDEKQYEKDHRWNKKEIFDQDD